MIREIALLLVGVLLLAMIMGCVNNQDKNFNEAKTKTHDAVTPAKIPFEEVQEWYWPRQEEKKARLKEGNVDLLFVGNSITHGWESTGKKYYEQYYAHRNVANIGFGWDRTQHVLWRLNDYDFSNISPKVAVVMIGTNNSNGDDNTAEEIGDGIVAVCNKLHTQFPKMKILLLAIFPRSPQPDAQRAKCAKASALASRIADNQSIFYLDLTDKFLEPDGTISPEIMPDYLHPNEEGYRIWAEAMEPVLVKLLGEEE